MAMHSIPLGMTEGELVQKICSGVAETAEVSEAELPPLHEAIHVDGLKALFAHANGRPSADVTVQFTYAGYLVTVSGFQHVSIEE